MEFQNQILFVSVVLIQVNSQLHGTRIYILRTLTPFMYIQIVMGENIDIFWNFKIKLFLSLLCLSSSIHKNSFPLFTDCTNGGENIDITKYILCYSKLNSILLIRVNMKLHGTRIHFLLSNYQTGGKTLIDITKKINFYKE